MFWTFSTEFRIQFEKNNKSMTKIWKFGFIQKYSMVKLKSAICK